MLLFLFCCTGITLTAQRVTLNGYITDKASGERLFGASILHSSGNGTTSNAYGFYSLTVASSADSASFIISYVGYNPILIKFPGNESKKINIELEQIKSLEEVVVSGKRKSEIHKRTQMSTVNVPVTFIKNIPAFLGEADVLKAIQLLPGVQAGTEGSNGIYVRGGGVDQNLILLDGVPVYNASHLFGFFSVFNADAVSSVDVMKGGFPARYGGRLSSVIDIRMKEGNNQEFHGEGGIGLIASRLTLEGPIKKGKSSFMISGRRTYADIFLRPIIRKQNNNDLDVGYFFYDLNAKANIYLTEKDHLYLSGYFGNDKFSSKEGGLAGNTSDNNYKSGIQWGNATGVMRWNHEFSRKLFSNATINYTRYKFDLFSDERWQSNNVTESALQRYYSGINDISSKIDFDFLPSARHFIKAGGGIIWHKYSPGAFHSKVTSTTYSIDTLLKRSFLTSHEYDAYVEDDIKLSDQLKINAGLHFSSFLIQGRSYNSLQPRLSARLLLGKEMSIKASYVQMTQFIHLLTNSGIGLPTDLWVPATSTVPPQYCKQAALGWAWNYKNDYEVSVEAYYKTMKNVIEYAEGASFLNTFDNWEQMVESGKGNSYGAEFFVQKKKGKTNGLIGYTISKTERQFNNLNGGKTFPYKYDRRHDIKIAVIHQFNKRFQLSADWVYGTGVATTLPVAIYTDASGREIEVYTSRNSFRMPAYHRMDVGLKWSKQKKHYERAWMINIYNVYNRLNAFYIYRDIEFNSATQTERNVFTKITLFPIIPSISYQFKF
ncbi:MAG: TonB-dependent receptor plug domain-containing protein [Lacibacter sp.]